MLELEFHKIIGCGVRRTNRTTYDTDSVVRIAISCCCCCWHTILATIAPVHTKLTECLIAQIAYLLKKEEPTN